MVLYSTVLASDSSFAYVMLFAGEMILAICSDSIAPRVDHKTSFFWGKMEQHLTELTLSVCPGNGKAQDLKPLGALKALRNLIVRPGCSSRSLFCRDPYCNLSEETLALKLPNLTSLRWRQLGYGKLVLSCPKLAGAFFDHTQSLHIILEDAAPTYLTLCGCETTQVAVQSAADQFRNLESLILMKCSEAGTCLIEYLGHMRRLDVLDYGDFPAACMPSSFPQSLRQIVLCPVGWCHDLPGGLKELHKLTDFCLKTKCKSWSITRPLHELLPMDNLEFLKLEISDIRMHSYAREECRKAGHLVLGTMAPEDPSESSGEYSSDEDGQDCLF